MMRRLSYCLLAIALLAPVSVGERSVKAENVCQVTDPTGTPLNVRDRPNGRIINNLRNGRTVTIQDTSYDSQGRPWAKIGGYYNGQYRVWGWVLREFISCYNR
ncbi:SH3 domain-containing protein [Argonema antarcticum]|uniref:SH3 domain-containing protein n=1 Tax=Argonema antarcticum TaxID=2942763 RepID=UPI0020127D0D|nr:SH3 domain-containing protein [Argonema antarcticum]MCL1473956.1 SH3 domain-containing protein [Argonema antarcticum A004/B2]